MKNRMKMIVTAVMVMMIAVCGTGCGGAKAPEEIGLSKEAIMLGNVGDTCNLAELLVIDEDADQTVNYASSDETVVSVEENGMLTAQGYGVASVTITSAADENVGTAIDVAVLDVTGTYSGEKYIAAMGCDVAIDITLMEDGTFSYYRAPMLVAIDGGGQMPELEDAGTYAIDGTTVTFQAETLGEYSAELSVKDGACLLSGSLPTGGAATDMVLKQKTNE